MFAARRALIAAVLVVSVLVTTAPAAESPSFTFAVVPQQAPSKLLASWGPLLKYLEQQTGYRFRFRTAPDIPTFEERLGAGEYAFAYMNPYHFTVFNRGEEGYQAVARAADKQIRGILVVRNDSPIASLQDLDGKVLAFPAPAAFAASILPRANLEARDIGFEARYVSSHDSVYLAVAKGLFAAGGGVTRTFDATAPAVREQLRVLWTTPGYTPHAIAVRADVAPDVASKVQEALAAMNRDPAGLAALERLKVNGFVPAVNADWDDVRALEIGAKTGNPGE